jgi:FKBP-type peptidyl-prolyl cis-trans isomerase
VQLGSGSVIPGWERGLVGIKKGGRRKLTIPPELGYGAEGYPPDIPPNETLVFVIDAIAVEPG